MKTAIEKLREEFLKKWATDADYYNGCKEMRKDLDALLSRPEETKQEGEWISVEERLPESEYDVLFLQNGQEPSIGFYSKDKGWCTVLTEGYQFVTHWIPKKSIALPSPPTTNNSIHLTK